MSFGIDERDYYSYDLESYPIKALTVEVTLKDASTVALREASVEVDASLELRVNESEMTRVRQYIEAIAAGYRYTVNFPLIAAE